MKKISLKNLGFTLIELLVVIAIIGILTAIVTANFAQSKAKARDAKRVSDLGYIQLVLELYFDKCNHYPSDITDLVAPCASGAKLGDYMSKLPTVPTPYTDSSHTTYAWGYFHTPLAAPTDYLLRILLETDSAARQESYMGSDFAGYRNGNNQLHNVDCNLPGELWYCLKPN